ncbi:MAG: TetR/AcrR family transcriptional regulator [Maricaulis sp.]|jgi:AcrR family transcriptional regulator|nr:TetR/AcrR family transcriptional regulator [Maricaulis sp.]
MTDIATAQARPNARSIANREKIYQAAMDLFRDRVFDAVTMQDIADQAGMSRASVFNHFHNKIALLGEFFERFTVEALEMAGASSATGFRGRLVSLFGPFGTIAHRNKPIIAQIASLAMGHGPLAELESELDNDLVRYFLDVIADAKQANEIRHDLDDNFLAHMLLGLLTVTAHDWVNSGQKTRLDEDLIARFDVLIAGVGN